MISKELQKVFGFAVNYARANNHEYITVEHIFVYLLKEDTIISLLEQLDIDIELIYKKLKSYILKTTTKFPDDQIAQDPIETIKLTHTIEQMITHAQLSGKQESTVEDMFVYILKDDETYATRLLKQQGLETVDILEEISHGGFEDEIASDEKLDETIEFEQLDRSKIKKTKNETILSQNSVELVQLAKKGEIDPVINRSKQINRVIEILARRKKNNPILLGETGVGKTAIAEGLALEIANQNVPEFLSDAKIYSLDMGSMVAGTKYRGDFEKKLKNILKEVSKKRNAILFIDEIHTVVGAGAVGNSTMDASNILKPMLSSGKLRVIGATTYEEYRNDFGKDKAFSRRFAKVEVDEPSIEDCVVILEGLIPQYEKFHNVTYTKESLVLAAQLSKKFINDRFLPDSAIDVIDETAATVKLKKSGKKNIKIKPKDIENTIASIANIPPKTATSSDLTLLKKLEQNLKKRVFGQDDAIVDLVKAIKINRAGLGVENKPVGSFLFTGTTGVGKTEVAQELANVMGIRFTRFDMSEYSEAHTVSRLIGAPAGYVGYEKGGLLTEAIKKHPHTVLLLDEIEKAHPDLMSLLLQVMDNATLTDNTGTQVDFQNVILIMTSNLGATQAGVMGFAKDDTINEDKAVKRFFAPEFRNRLDATIKFAPLNQAVILKIVTKFIKDIEKTLDGKNIKIKITTKAKKELAKLGYDKLMGARPLQRVIRDRIKTALTDEILFGKLKDGGVANIDFVDDKFNFEYTK